jgi:hypothetical protein
MDWDAKDPHHRAILETARAWGVSPSRFMGEKSSSVTTHEFDPAGRVVRSETVYTPDWTEDDVRGALALRNYEAELCPGCHHPFAETANPDNEFEYEALPPIRCHRCTKRENASEGYRDSPNSSALFIPIELRNKS